MVSIEDALVDSVKRDKSNCCLSREYDMRKFVTSRIQKYWLQQKLKVTKT